MPSRERPAGSNRVLVDLGIQMLGQRDDLMPCAVFFDLGAGDERWPPARIERPNYLVERCNIRRNRLGYLAGHHWRTVAIPIIHWNRNEHRPLGWLGCNVVTASDRCRDIFGPQRL